MAHTLRASSNGVHLVERIRAAFHGLEKAYARKALYWRTVKELQSLSDRDLRDLGISRSAIRGLARETVYNA
ncbi:DUF1127 domain-containing protein [Pseudooceanicola sp.]|uniref:DUF1127 domain-containing protein n=1 Tax=Pseudooceanicola sp. TaxID=1914328 RepID=UPI0035115057